MLKLKKRISLRIAQLREALWLDELYLKRRWYIVLMRIIAIFWRGVFDNSLFSRAAALSYSSLLALAPILGITVLLSSSFMRVNSEDHIKKVMLFIAPSMEQYVDGKDADVTSTDVVALAAPNLDAEQQQQMREMEDALDLLITHMIDGVNKHVNDISKSGKNVASFVGGLMLIWMGITLLVAIENAMNGIWGVTSGRAWGRKIVLYWAVLSLGTLALFALMGMSSAFTLAKTLKTLPLGSKLAGVSAYIAPMLSVAGLTVILTFFYKFFPNTRVRFLPALVGGFVAAMMLVANNMLSIMYISKVITIQSLYGSMGIIIVLMFGLYLFWAFLLLGGQLTFAVQNAQFLADQKVWQNVSYRTRETIAFAALTLIARRFARCQPAISADELAESLRVPANILNESLNRLSQMGLITALEVGSDEGNSDSACFTPARPLKNISFTSFRNSYSAFGADRSVALLCETDPLVALYRKSMEQATLSVTTESMETLLERTEPQVAAKPSSDESSSFPRGEK